LDFGSAYPGSTTTLTNALVISNCGDVDVWVEVEAGPVGTLFYDELELDSGLGWYFWEDWGTTILAGSNKSVDAQLYIPSGTLPGADSGTLNFWATEAI
jgi:hypothetical protein